MGLPKKAKGGSKTKSKGGKGKDGRPKEPRRPHFTVRNVRMPIPGIVILAAARPAVFCSGEHPRKFRSWGLPFLVRAGPGALPLDITRCMPAKQLLLSSRCFHSWWAAGAYSLVKTWGRTAAAGCATHQSSQLSGVAAAGTAVCRLHWLLVTQCYYTCVSDLLGQCKQYPSLLCHAVSSIGTLGCTTGVQADRVLASQERQA